MTDDIYASLRIVDLTMGWAGPLATMLFADYGAEVIKIEGPTRPDWWRSGSASRPPADFENPAARNWERSSLFNGVNRNKRGMVLDLDSEQGQRILRELIASADVLVESFSPRVMTKWGLTYDKLRADNERLIMMSLPAAGSTGPWSHYVGYAPTTEALSGMPALCGYPGGAPVLQGPLLADPLGGLNGAVALAMALYDRESSGKGTSIEVAQTEAMTPLIGPALLDWQFNGRNLGRTGDALQGDAPSGCFRCVGLDSWLVISACSDDEWIALCDVIERPDLRDDPELRDRTGRALNRDALNQAIALWSSTRDARASMELLQGAGVTAGCVNDAVDLISDPQVAATGGLVTIEHPVAGPHPYPNVTVKMTLTPGRIRSSAPLFGQDSDEILCDVLGLDADEIASLHLAGVISRTPIFQ